MDMFIAVAGVVLGVLWIASGAWKVRHRKTVREDALLSKPFGLVEMILGAALLVLAVLAFVRADYGTFREIFRWAFTAYLALWGVGWFLRRRNSPSASAADTN